MALSPYRFSLDDGDSTLARPRTGLSSVTAGGGATSGGEGYRQSALMPGSRGYMAATFGGAPDPTYVAPTKTATVTNPTPTPTATQTATPTVTPVDGEAARTDAGEAAQTGVVDGEPGNLDLFGDLGVDGKTVGGLLGGALGGLAFGPLGAVGGALAGRAIGSTFDGGGGSAPGMGGDPANAQSGASENSAANSGASQAGNMMGDGTYAEGGRVTHLFKGKQMHGQHKGGLSGVMAGGKNMGGYAEGGRVPIYPETVAPLFAGDPGGRLPIMSRPGPGQPAVYDERINGNNFLADLEARVPAPDYWPARTGHEAMDRVRQLLRSRPDIADALAGAQQDIYAAPAANSPATGMGYMGAYAEGGPVLIPDDVNAALWRRAQDQAAPTPEMVQAARVANAPTEMRRGGMRFAENNARTDAYMNARYGSDPQFRPEARYLGDPVYLTGDGQGMDDPLLWYHAMQRQRDAVNGNTQMIEGAPIGPDHPLFTPRSMRQPQFRGAYSMGGKVKMPNYAEGGTVDALAGPNPPGPDDGFAALDGGEFVVRRTMADKYAPILDDINEGRYPMPGQGGGMAPQGEGMGDLDLPMGAQGNMPPSMAESATPDDMMQRLATLPPEQRQSLQMAMSDPMLSGALFALLGPSFMPVIAMLQQPMAPQGMGQPAMMATSPDLAGSRPMGGLGAVNA